MSDDLERAEEAVSPPILVSASPVGAQANSALAAALLIASALPALMAVLGTRDVVQIVGYLGSSQFAPVLGLIVAAGTVAWRQITTRRSHQEKVVVAEAAPNAVAVVKES